VDSARGIVFVACTDHVVALDAAHDGAIVASAPVGEGIDNIDYVESRHELFVAASRPAKLAVLRFEAGAFHAVATGTTARGARVVVADDSGTAFVGDPVGGRVLVFRSTPQQAATSQSAPAPPRCSAAAVVPVPALVGGTLPLAPVADVPLPGNASRFDYQTIEPASRRLYIAHLGDSSLLVFDLDGQCVLREIPDLPSVHGVVVAPELHRIFATATAQKTLAIIDDGTFEVQARVPAGEYPNGLAFDPASGHVFVSNNRGTGVGVVDAKAARPLAGVDVGGGAGNTQFDAGTGHVLAAVHGQAFLADIDPATSKVAGRIALSGVSTCHGLLVASSLRLAFAACRGGEPRLAVVDLRTRRETSTLPLPPDIDVLAFDEGLGRLYAAAETGTVVAFAVAPDGSVTELGRGTVGPDAHSVAVDPATHRVYFPLANVGGHPVLRVMAPVSRSSGGGS
jgi:DNA-binding beta-propeller fold protein YncE